MRYLQSIQMDLINKIVLRRHLPHKQLHKALLLNDNAEVNCKPELEIYADDVKCSHGATSGNIDEEQLFYMRSRGISEDDARQILVEAFLDNVLMRASSETIKTWLKEQI